MVPGQKSNSLGSRESHWWALPQGVMLPKLFYQVFSLFLISPLTSLCTLGCLDSGFLDHTLVTTTRVGMPADFHGLQEREDTGALLSRAMGEMTGKEASCCCHLNF